MTSRLLMTQSGHGQANFAVMHNRATLRILCRNQRKSTGNSQSLRQTPLQWEIVALIKALNVVAIEAFVTDLHPGAQCAHGRKLLDGEPDRLRCRRKAAIVQRLSWPALALCHEQLGGNAVVEWLGLGFYKSSPPCSARSLRTRPSYIPGHLEKFFSPSRYESDSLTAMGHGRIERASHGADGL